MNSTGNRTIPGEKFRKNIKFGPGYGQNTLFLYRNNIYLSLFEITRDRDGLESWYSGVWGFRGPRFEWYRNFEDRVSIPGFPRVITRDPNFWFQMVRGRGKPPPSKSDLCTTPGAGFVCSSVVQIRQNIFEIFNLLQWWSIAADQRKIGFQRGYPLVWFGRGLAKLGLQFPSGLTADIWRVGVIRDPESIGIKKSGTGYL